MTNVIIFGPPGVGKSTTIRAIADIVGRNRAIDLEDEENKWLLNLMGYDWMFNAGRLGGSNYIGGADLSPRRTYPNTVKVVLCLSDDQYRSRRRQRDQREPNKARQPPQMMSGW